MIVLLCACIVACTTYCGYAVSRTYFRREEIQGEILRLIARLKDDLCFFRERLPAALLRAGEELGTLSDLLGAFVAGLEGGEKLLPNPGLKEEEFRRLCELLRALGKSDAGRTGEILARAEEEFSRLRQEAERERRKFAAMYVKLGFTAGLLICIVLL